jgi:tripartite-type tricarboxylate transporter receptor subunit TctC
MRRLLPLLLLLPLAAGAADYPTRPIALIAPFTAGGPVDLAARIAAEGLAGQLGQGFAGPDRVELAAGRAAAAAGFGGRRVHRLDHSDSLAAFPACATGGDL